MGKPRERAETLRLLARLSQRQLLRARTTRPSHQKHPDLRALDQAAERLQQTPRAAEPGWLDWFSPSRLDGFAGYTQLQLGRWEEAQSSLTRALAAEPGGGKQRSVFLADLAATHLQQGHLDKGCEVAAEALTVAAGSGYATGMQRVRELHGKMAPWSTAPAVKQFSEQLVLCNA